METANVKDTSVLKPSHNYNIYIYIYIYSAGVAAFTLLYIWANFFNRHAINIDMYADAQVAQLMWQQKTLFPSNWVFGNQYYVVATPVFAAIFYGLCGNKIIALGAASTAMLVLQLLAFVWMIRPFTKVLGTSAGLFAISGAVILGTSVSMCTSGMMLLYSMASYYSCYMLGIMLTLGVYLRLTAESSPGPFSIVLSLLLSLGLGVQSVRETLVLVIPLVLMALLHATLERRSQRVNWHALAYVGAITACNLLGVALMTVVPAESFKAISGLQIPASTKSLAENASSSFYNFIGITGLQYSKQGFKWMPLALAAAIICAGNLLAVCYALHNSIHFYKKKQSFSPKSFLVLFCMLSLLGVFAVGTLLSFSVRTVYYFVWFLLSAVSFTLLIEQVPGNGKRLVLIALLYCGACSLFYNTYPDLVQHQEQEYLFDQTSQYLIDEGIDQIYVEYTTYYSSAIAACSDEQIEAAPVWLGIDSNGEHSLRPFPFLINKLMFNKDNASHAAIILAESKLAGTSSFTTLSYNPECEKDILSKIELIAVKSNQYNDIYIYRIVDPTVLWPDSP